MTEPDAERVGRPHLNRTFLVSFLGAVVRRMGGWMPTAGAIDLMGQCGVDATSARTAIFRLKKRDWLVAQATGGMRGYALTELAARSLDAGDDVIWHARKPADLKAGWCIVHFSVPEAARARRHQLRAHLASLGFGNVGTAVWIAPARMLPAAESAIAELELERHSAVFVGDHVAGQDLGVLIQEGWDLESIDRRYHEFIARFSGLAEDRRGGDSSRPRQAFVTYMSVIDHWRKLPFRDPGLPREVLPPQWAGHEAVALFERIVERFEGRALAYAARYWEPPGD
ncbi:PaaX family transcriptional regulator C-terminal domain-containing protein [Sphaerisporangium sp. NPDC051011]|uniref:PaaX family transcriptional regulator n=1 Tax=Sphaerisporangium sp. NPDC051011 TaxID=3155792 RepID=UPI0033C07FB4